MYGIDRISVPEIDDYFEVLIAADDIISAKATSVTPKVSNPHIIYITNLNQWWSVRTGEYSRKFTTIVDEYAIYHSDHGVLIPVSKVARSFVISGDIIDTARHFISNFGFSNPLILFNNKGVVYVIEPDHLRYLCFKLIPQSKKTRLIESVEIEYFWEIISIALTSDRKTAYEIKMKI